MIAGREQSAQSEGLQYKIHVLCTTHAFQILAFNFELIYNSDRSVLMPQSERLHNHCGLGECAFRCVALNSRVVGGGAGGEGGLTPL